MTTYPTPASGHLHVTPEGRQLIIERIFRAPIEDVWASLTEPDRVARWYGIIEGDPFPGHTIMVTMTAEEEPRPNRFSSSSAIRRTASSWSRVGSC
ncbi:MAG: SRPBCC domain-containing protein [Ilumatobacter sp.]